MKKGVAMCTMDMCYGQKLFKTVTNTLPNTITMTNYIAFHYISENVGGPNYPNPGVIWSSKVAFFEAA